MAAPLARVADALAEGLDPDGGRWYVVCENHGELVQVESRDVARADARAANVAGECEWCEECRSIDADGRPHEIGCPAYAGAPDFCTCNHEEDQ